ncbi:transposase [Streptomyces yunnanensis]|uniref:transposase n=1 Tax=Streptomyces yunnanensis TaxID=156453 RepID=UPI003B836AE7
MDLADPRKGLLVGRRSPYPAEFRNDAVALYRAAGGKRTYAAVAADVGVTGETLRSWVRRADELALHGRGDEAVESWRAGELESWRAGELESWRAGVRSRRGCARRTAGQRKRTTAPDRLAPPSPTGPCSACCRHHFGPRPCPTSRR